MNPSHILLIKSHSMGIGDLLRSSAAWQALKTKWPQVQLHLLMLSKHPGYPTEQLIREHHLHTTANFVSVTKNTPHDPKPQRLATSVIQSGILTALGNTPFDLVIDCEPFGLRTSLLTRRLTKHYKAKSVGIAQFPLRRFFYDTVAPSVKKYMDSNGLALPLDYTERDFVVLSALGIVRNGLGINLKITPQGLAWQKKNMTVKKPLLVVTLNIGCGTRDALPRRPQLDKIVPSMVALYQILPYQLQLSGADFEREENLRFLQLFQSQLGELDLECDVNDWSGRCTLCELTGLLGASDLVISSDSGPYHMAVGLQVPTVCWFNFAMPEAYHQDEHVRVLVQPEPAQFIQACQDLVTLG